MINVSLIISSIIFSGMLSGIIVMTLVIYSHPDDKNQAYLPKLVVFLGLFFSAGAVFLIPLDVGNALVDGGIDMWTAWAVAVIGMMVILVVAIPFAFWFYESDISSDGESKLSRFKVSTQFASALVFTVVLIVVFGITLGVLYAFLNKAEIPVSRQTML